MIAQGHRFRSRLVGTRGGLVAAAILSAFAAHAAPGATRGAFDLIRDAAHQCRLTLRSEATASGFALAMPAGCHRAFPALGTVALWSALGDGRVTFADPAGSPILMFETAGDGLEGTGPDGQTYRLHPVDAASVAVLRAAETADAVPAEEGARVIKVAASNKPPASVKATDVAGRYSVLRDKDKDTGCMLTLDDKAHGPGSTLKARLAPACRDQGIVIFDPVGWQIQGARMVLTARKGHTTHLDTQDDGSWMKDPKEGKSLSLKKM